MSQALSLDPRSSASGEWLRRAVQLRAGQTVHPLRDEHRISFVLSGWLCRSRFMADGTRQIVELILPGEHETSQPHGGADYDVLSALCACEVYSVALTEVQNAMRASHDFQAQMTSAETRRCAIQDERVVSLGRRTSLARMCHIFCELVVRSGLDTSTTISCACPLSQAELADLLGLSTVHTFRLLQMLSQRGIAKLSRGVLTIMDHHLLISVAGFSERYLRGAGASVRSSRHQGSNAPNDPAHATAY